MFCGCKDKKKITTIYNPVIFYEIKYHKIKYKDIKGKKNINIAVIGWIQPRKAQDIIIKAFSEVKDRNFTLNFIGGVEDKTFNDEVLRLIEDNKLKDKVKFWGARKDVFKILDQMDILVSASRGEALPTVMIEALYCEKPIISSDCDYGPKEILDNGKYGLIFKVDDYNGLAKCFNTMVNNNELYTTPAFEGGQDARSVLEYSMSDLADADRKAVQERIDAGQTMEAATEEFQTEEYFDRWYEDTLTKLQTYEG